MTTTVQPAGDAPHNVRVYEAGGRTSFHPLSHAKQVWQRRALMHTMARAKRKAANAHTILGQIWLVLGPLTQAAVYVLLIGILRGQINEPGRIQLIISGIFLFTFTRASIQKGAGSVAGNVGLLLNASLPRGILPTSAVLEGFYELLPGLAAYAVIHLATGLSFGVSMLAFPGLLALHALFNLGVAMLIAIVTVYVPDVRSLLGHVMRLWMYCTPVIYPVSDLRSSLTGLKQFLALNPVWHLFDAYHRVLYEHTWPTASQILITSAWAVGVFVVGSTVFLWKERFVAIRV